jgi:predicted metal-dependent hydrolase
MEKHKVIYGDNIIEFELERKDVKNINLNIRPDMNIVVSANDKVPLEFIKDFVKSKSQWILKNVDYFKEAQPESRNEKEYVSGESFKYLGRQYRLRVKESETEGVKYFRGFIYIYVKDTTNFKRKKKLFNDWLNERANIIFNDSLDRMFCLVSKYGISKPNLNIREMRARWGSYLRDTNTIILNAELIKAPKYCIDYVVLHELIHYKHRNHGNEFYSFLTTLMPDWEKRKTILDEEIVRDL